MTENLKAFVAVFTLILGLSAEPVAADAVKRPNIVFVLADDLGFEALGAYGGVSYEGLGPVRTPNLDALARGGMRFQHCFATPVCSPARAELLTGKYNFRSGFIDIAGRKGAVSSLDAQAHPTLAARLKAAGYVTAVVGKWHLGPPTSMEEIPTNWTSGTDYPHVRACGFDRQCIFGGAHLELYGSPEPGKYTPQRLHDWALRFLDSRKGQAKPFFLYYASPIPHSPVLPTPLNPQGRRGLANFPLLVEYLDQQVGQIVRKLEELGMKDNTLILFSGDNGTDRVATEMRDGKVVRGGKGSMQDTGSRVPLVASWPGVVPAGTVYDGLVDFSDIMPTCLELAHAVRPAGLDGVSFAAQLQGKTGMRREWVHVLYVDRYFVRDAKWKLRENGALYDVSDSPYVEKLVAPSDDTNESKAARQRLQAVLRKLHP